MGNLREGVLIVISIDQYIVVLWFLPVVISIIIPLCATCAYSLFSLLKRLVLGKEEKLMKAGLSTRQVAYVYSSDDVDQ